MEAAKKGQLTLKNVKKNDLVITGAYSSSDISYKAMCGNSTWGRYERPMTASFLLEKDLGAINYEQEFRAIYEIAFLEEHREKMNSDPAVEVFNRYTDILPFEDTRVVLKSGTSPYINANYISSPFTGGDDRKIIAAQGPMSNTVEHFWQLVVQEEVTLIVSVCKLWERG